ncbi:hypothetical protein GWK47_003924 [Chionoecetes opilio]|uniref:Uncharacterized protein n=1 Tax=Chionoecetes opilio TaxID=41210 RepID=A0A8J4YPI0_CHIOP|nr:hypothetical protein GWK47_003924 [Chionoecetes opilio]
MHQARWMAKILYSLKIWMLRDQLHDLTKWEEKCARDVALSAATVYMKPWFTTSLAAAAPRTDLDLLQKLRTYPDPQIAKVSSAKLQKHLWYLSEELVGFAFFDEEVPPETKRAMVQAMREEENSNDDGIHIHTTWYIQTCYQKCIGKRPKSRRGFVSTETLDKIKESRAARLAGNQDQHRALSRQTRTRLGRDKERYVRSLAEDVEGHLNANDLRPTYRALKKLRFESPSRARAIRAADGRVVSEMDGQMALWAEYFGQLFTVDPPIGQLYTTGLQTS